MITDQAALRFDKGTIAILHLFIIGNLLSIEYRLFHTMKFVSTVHSNKGQVIVHK